MNYIKIYNRLIDRAKERVLTEYTEKHHIVPRCMGGGDEESNIAVVTPEEHYVCHQLLAKIYPDNQQLLYACMAMTGNRGERVLNNKAYGWIRRRISKDRTGKTMAEITGDPNWVSPKRGQNMKERHGPLWESKSCKAMVIRDSYGNTFECIKRQDAVDKLKLTMNIVDALISKGEYTFSIYSFRFSMKSHDKYKLGDKLYIDQRN